MVLTHVDLFSGIGGFALGFRRTGGIKTVAFCEIDGFCRKVLRKNFPDVPVFKDVRCLLRDSLNMDKECDLCGELWCDLCEDHYAECNCVTPEMFFEEVECDVDIVSAGWPCQDISIAGKQAGIEAIRSGLWSEVFRVCSVLRPRFIVLENVAAILSGERGAWMGRVQGDLAELGYSAIWGVVPASYIGANHIRRRWWCIAIPNADSDRLQGITKGGRVESPPKGEQSRSEASRAFRKDESGGARRITLSSLDKLAHGLSGGLARPGWLPEPPIQRMSSGVPDRANKLKGLGNAIVPQIATIIGNAILEAEA